MLTEQQVLNKIKKLMALAENSGATEAERNRALAQAQKFAAKYNLDLAVAESGDSDTDRTNAITEFPNNPANRVIANSVAKLYFVKYIFFRGSNRHMFVGKQVNIDIAISMAKWVIKTAQTEARRVHRITPEFWKSIPQATFVTSFMKGVANGVSNKVAEIIEATKDEKPTINQPGTSLVLADVYRTELARNEDWLAKNHGPTRTSKMRSSRVNIDAYARGVQHGRSVNLNKQVANS